MLDLIFEKRSLENPSTSLSDPANWLFHAMGAVPSQANVIVNTKTALTLTAVWSATNTISDAIAELPIRLVRKQRNGKMKIVNGHPAHALLTTSPNPFMTPMVYKSTEQSNVLLWGNGYGIINHNRAGEPAEIWPLDPAQTTPRVMNKRLVYDTVLDSGAAVVSADQVMHIPALVMRGLAGISIIGSQREALGQAIALQQFGSKFFANGARPSGLVSFPETITDPVKVRDLIQKQYAGENAHGLLVLDKGADYKQFAVPPDDAQFLQSKEFSVDDIGRMFRLPAHFLNKMGQATFNNLESMGTHFVIYTLLPWIRRWEEECNRKLLTDEERAAGYSFKFIVAGLLRGDAKTRAEFYSKAIKDGWMTRNEARALEDMNPIDGLDRPLVPMNMAEVGAAQNPPQQRSDRIVQAMCERLVAQEVNFLERSDRDQRKIEFFYDRQVPRLIENLALSDDTAQAYAASRTEQLGSGELDADAIRQNGVNELLHLVGEQDENQSH